jgi:N-methylhydantoinase A
MGSPVATRPVYRNGSWHEASVYRGEQLHRGSHIEGLAIIEMPDTTIVVGENQSADVDRLGNVILKLDV